MRSSRNSLALAGALAALLPAAAAAQSLDSLVMRVGAMSAVTGLEDAMADSLLSLLEGAHRDRAGNVVQVRGSGAPVRIASCPMDEIGYVVGGISAEGYLTLRRVGGTNVGPLYDQFLEGQRVTVFGRRGAVPGVVGVRSTHLTRGRPSADDPPFSLDNAWVDVGATNARDVAALGIVMLSPMTRAKRVQRYGDGGALAAAPWMAQRASCAALLSAARRTTPGAGTTVVAFTSQRHMANTGAAFLGVTYPGADILTLGAAADSAGAARVSAGWGLNARYLRTPVETVAMADVARLEERLVAWLGGRTMTAVGRYGGRAVTAAAALAVFTALPPYRLTAQQHTSVAETRDVLGQLVEAYGPSGHEGPVRDLVLRMLPSWAAPTTDTAGNIWVRVGQGAPLVVFVAHLDEIGFEVSAIRPDGQLVLRTVGGFFPSLFEAEQAMVHTANGIVPAVFTLRDSVGATPRRTPTTTTGGRVELQYRVDPGTTDAAGTAALGIRVGDVVTMPKAFVPLYGNRATGRSFDDRAGVAAQILAMRRLVPSRLRHEIIFIFSTREETGLFGARAVANALGTAPAKVYALDTFVSADAPLEVRSFADAPIGAGAVARSVDNSSVTPPAVVDSLVALAAQRQIPLQVGTTNGGNDGSVFTRYGVTDVPIGWPLRYSHSPAEVIDLRDVASLADLVLAIAERW